MCRQTLTKRVVAKYQEGKDKLAAHLPSLKAVCTTADCWSSRGKSHIGVTCHWVDPITLKRTSICLAIRRILGRHTYDAIGKILEAINTEFGIDENTMLTITDSGSNFLKAFRVFGASDIETAIETNEEDEDDVVGKCFKLKNGFRFNLWMSFNRLVTMLRIFCFLTITPTIDTSFHGTANVWHIC